MIELPYRTELWAHRIVAVYHRLRLVLQAPVPERPVALPPACTGALDGKLPVAPLFIFPIGVVSRKRSLRQTKRSDNRAISWPALTSYWAKPGWTAAWCRSGAMTGLGRNPATYSGCLPLGVKLCAAERFSRAARR